MQANLLRTKTSSPASDLVSARLATLTPNDPSTRDAAPTWSERLGERFGCTIEPTLADWLDSEVWKESGAGEFHHAVSPDSLLADHSDVIWPGLMLPDTLPLIGNRYGDWLCLRVGPDNSVSEIIHWYHGGGDWIPWGRSLGEAIVFDSLRSRLPGRRQSHAIDAEPRIVSKTENPYLAWALKFTGEASYNESNHDARVPSLDWVNEHRWSEVALNCELALNALDSSLRRNMTPDIAGRLGIDWEPQVVSWLFDEALVPEEIRSTLASNAEISLSLEQQWDVAKSHALNVATKRDDLVWAFDVLGWAEEREGRLEEAAKYYQKGCLALAFADQSIRFRTHWFPQWAGKFSTWRLTQLLDSGNLDHSKLDAPVRRYLTAITGPSTESLRIRAMAYWRNEAADAVNSGRWQDAYDAFYRAGWDLGTDTMIDFGELLNGLSESAKRAGQSARAAVAEFHLDTFVSRFG